MYSLATEKRAEACLQQMKLLREQLNKALAERDEAIQDRAEMEAEIARIHHRRDVAVHIADRLAAALLGFDDEVVCSWCGGTRDTCQVCDGRGKVMSGGEDSAGPVAEAKAIEEADQIVDAISTEV